MNRDWARDPIVYAEALLWQPVEIDSHLETVTTGRVLGTCALDAARRHGLKVGVDLDRLPEKRFRGLDPRTNRISRYCSRVYYDIVVRFRAKPARSAKKIEGLARTRGRPPARCQMKARCSVLAYGVLAATSAQARRSSSSARGRRKWTQQPGRQNGSPSAASRSAFYVASKAPATR